MKSFLMAMVLAASILVPGAQAAGESGKKAATDNPHLLKAQEQARAIAGSFSEAEIRDLAQIRDAFGLVRSVQVVKRDVVRAVGQCGKANPEMKGFMEAGLKSWDQAVSAAVDPRDKEIKTIIRDGRFKKPKEVEAFLESLDKAAQFAENKLDKRVVTTPEACTGLAKSMDETQDVITSKMGEIKLPAPRPEEAEPSAGGMNTEGKAP